ncbi:ribosomal L1 domain-containing protein CG13096 [Drosophila takahashii]|uniref:ribosomal L1 domain-containing protein CG13096 n=1 Tax=Drosophila takahashii TaxID=29030 RepID=UPI0038991411
MVKVQKPQPKSLNKSASIEGVVKKKGKAEKSKKLPVEATLDLVSSKKSNNAAAKKTDAAKKVPKVSKKEADKKQPKAAKRPLILAPPESPAAPQPAEKKSKTKPAPVAKKSAAKKPLILAPPESPVAPKKQEKKAKAASVAGKKEPAQSNKSVQDAAPVKKSAPATAPTKKIAPPAKKSAPAAPAAKKSAPGAPPAKKNQKPAAEALKKTQKTAKGAPQAKPAKAQPAAQLQKKTKPVQKLSKPAKAPKSKKPFNKSKPGQAKTAKKEPVKAKKPVELTFELKSFDEKRYQEIVSENNVTKVCQALKTLVSEEVAKKKTTSIFSDYRYVLQVSSYKIASCPKRMVKLNLKHSLVGSDDDVALIVTDLQRGAKFDSDPTKQHYEDLLREAGVKQRLTIVPFNQLRNDMGSFEAKRKFLNSYDYLLCDGRLSGQASAFLGKQTQRPSNVLHAVRLSKDNDKLPQEVTRALSRTAFRQLAKGDLTSIPVGNHEISPEQLAENILFVSKQLQQVYPGGLANIRSMYLRIDITGTSALPLYVSMCAPPADTPYVVGPREQRMLKLKKQANEVLSKFALTKDAEFIKLTRDQVKRKAELREEKAALLAADAAAPKDNDGEDTAVPTKKARKDSSSEGAKAEAESDEEEEGEDAEDSAGESGEDGDDTDEDDDDENDDDDDDEDDDEEDDDEEDDDEDEDDE